MAEPIDLDATSFPEEVLSYDGVVLVDFWSPTCPHCRKLAPDFAAAAEQCGDRAKFAKVSVQDARPLFSEHGITAVPTLILFNCGKKVAQRQGALSPEQILTWIDEALPTDGRG